MRNHRWLALTALLCCQLGWAGTRQYGTGGASQFEGSAGGGLVPWAVIQGYGAGDETDVTAFASYLATDDYRLTAWGVAAGVNNRFEFSYARQELDLVTLGPAIGLPGATLEQEVFGAKVRLAGSLFYTPLPQITAGVHYKRNRDFLIPSLVGARDDDDFDFYVSVARLWLAGAGGYNLFANGTLRWTRANEAGLLGFGGDLGDDRELRFEGAAGLFFARRWAVGLEYRDKGGQLGFAAEDAWWDAFVAWVPNRHLSVVAAWVDLGSIAGLPGQDGLYLSIEGGF